MSGYAKDERVVSTVDLCYSSIVDVLGRWNSSIGASLRVSASDRDRIAYDRVFAN